MSTYLNVFRSSSSSSVKKTHQLIHPHSFETILPCLQKLPQFLADTHYQNPSDMTNTAFQRGHNTTEPLFGWIVEHPSKFNAFNQYMTKQREGRPTWLDVFPVEETLAKNIDPETPLFVDVGGGVGHQCAALKAHYPHVKGKVILQDLPQVLEQKLAIDGVEAMGTDFWKEQPVKGTPFLFPTPLSPRRQPILEPGCQLNDWLAFM